jgi:hypothetical protein
MLPVLPRVMCGPIAFLALATLACDGQPPVAEPAQCWNVLTYVPLLLRARVDLLFVVGNASSMAEEQAALADEVRELVAQLEALPAGVPDLHAAVMSDDGAALLAPDTCPALTDGGQVVIDEVLSLEPSAREVNYTGDLASQLACMVAVGTAGDEVERPLASLAGALEDGANGFRRPGVPLAIAIVSDGEDASPDEVAAYFDRVRAVAPTDASVSVVSGGIEGCTRDGFTDAAPAPRLVAFAGDFGHGGSAVSLCDDDPLLAGLAGALASLPVDGCLPDEVPSPPDCTLADVSHRGQATETGYAIHSCAEGSLPCFVIAKNELACPDTALHRHIVVERGGATPPDDTLVIGSCSLDEECL